ncbi:hypothetical protein CBI38_31440 (plasmid) [Rhodococcus oxybenzonivorans]|uniref:Uncharacterized protein n=1 Tax=Rhodococcus oxybenzonivorans TaxID=1990687 RepID=A0A2S2C5C2_9NOCA|nr:hypothetical protein CBI38_31440 [Rhodococcus oxybenzonivorans]
MARSSTVSARRLGGWFSVHSDGNTGGDLLALDTVADWLRERRVSFSVAVSEIARYADLISYPMVRADTVHPADADILVWMRGPLSVDAETPLLAVFAGKPRIAWGVSTTPPDAEGHFDTVIARDRPGEPGRLDLSFRSRTAPVPVVGLIYAGPQPDYRTPCEPVVRTVVRDALATRDNAKIEIATRMPVEGNRLQTPAQREVQR